MERLKVYSSGLVLHFHKDSEEVETDGQRMGKFKAAEADY